LTSVGVEVVEEDAEVVVCPVIPFIRQLRVVESVIPGTMTVSITKQERVGCCREAGGVEALGAVIILITTVDRGNIEVPEL